MPHVRPEVYPPELSPGRDASIMSDNISIIYLCCAATWNIRMNATKLVIFYAIVILSLSVNLVYTQQENAGTQLYNQLYNQLCTGQVDDRYSHTTHNNAGLPGKRGAKGDKGDSSSFYTNEENNQKFARKLVSLHKQLISVQVENQNLHIQLNTTEQKLAIVEKKFEDYKTESRFSDIADRLGPIGVTSCQEVPRFYGTTSNGIYLIQPSYTVPPFNVTCYFNTNTGVMNSLERPRSCQDVATIFGHARDGTYSIKPNPSLPAFEVHCSFSGNTATTSVAHDSEAELEVSDCGSAKCYNRVIRYTATIPQIRALIAIDGECRQYIKYRCKDSRLFRSIPAGWESWDGTLRHYWGGSGGREGYCACGVTGTCADTRYQCNCDKNDQVWREDAGYLDQEQDLPVTKLYFGDTNGPTQNGHHTLGSLQCRHNL